jgi:membrane-associated protease RseP (regulator of RpoE activity)
MIVVAVVVVMAFVLIYLTERQKKEDVLAVASFNEADTSSYEQILVQIDNLNTENFKAYFSNMKVLLIYPYINPVYEDKISMVYVYKSIDKFKEYYIDKLKNLGYYAEANKYSYTPIKISGVVIYSNLEELKYKYSDKIIDKCEHSSFYCVKLE